MTDKFDMSDITMNGAPGDSTASLKKLLTIAAGVVVLFLIVLIIMKAIGKNDIDTTTNLQMPSEEELTKKEQVKVEPVAKVEEAKPANSEVKVTNAEPKPEPKAQSKPEPQISKVEIKNEVKEEPKVVSETIVPENKVEIKKPEVEQKIVEVKKDEPKTVVTQKVEPAKEPIKVEVKKPEPKKEEVKKEVAKTEPKKVETKKEEPKKAEVKKPEPKKEEVKKAEVKKPEIKQEEPKKEAVKPGTAAKSVSTSIGGGSYVQVFATNVYDPNSSDVRKIVAKGYNPVGLKTQVNGKEVVKILVGPFNGDALNKAISDMRTINAGAFVYRAK